MDRKKSNRTKSFTVVHGNIFSRRYKTRFVFLRYTTIEGFNPFSNDEVEYYLVSLSCWNSLENREYSIEAMCELKVLTENGVESIGSQMNCFVFEGDDVIFEIDCEKMEKFLINGTLTVEFDVCIKKMTGMQLFDESMKKYSDVVLIVEDEKFYVSKLFLASQSSYFDALLLGNFNESTQSEVTLTGISAKHFKWYLNALHGHSVINGCQYEKILELAHMYDSHLVVAKCETFLLEASRISIAKKLELAVKYQLDDLKYRCLANIKTVQDIRSVVPRPCNTMDHDVLANLFDKLLALNDTEDK
ncbi:hypothetical protein CRE_09401 [Caenorhabditis remanei]|uniref:BTB domain-containing protein n=1 Tax=Caenorhabditis remanei TaxID=31234 RepID=E3LIN5_CAERE|nr:hypothetical protein CRE_09401 [Caenorhabditis remanei]